MLFPGIFAVFLVGLASCAPTRPEARSETESKKKTNISTNQATASPGDVPSTPGSFSTFRGSSARTGQGSVPGPRTSNVKWVFRTRGRVYGDVVFGSDDTLYVASHDHHVYAVGLDGREKWSLDTGGKIWSTPSVARDGTLYVGSDSDQLFAINPTGDIKWIFPTTPAATPKTGKKSKSAKKAPKSPDAGKWDVDTSPAVLEDGTIVFGCHYYLYALRPSGIVRWFFQAGVDRTKIFSSPAVGPDGTIYFGSQGGYIFALNQSAKVLWHKRIPGDTDSTPVVDDSGAVYFASDDGKIRAFMPDGTPKWSTDVGAPMRAPLAIGRNKTIYASTYGERPVVIAIDRASGEEKWRFAIEPGEGAFYGIQSGVLVDSDGFLYFGGRDHYVYCLSPRGKMVWRYKTGDQVDASPVLGPDGTLYVGSDDNRLYAFGKSE